MNSTVSTATLIYSTCDPFYVSAACRLCTVCPPQTLWSLHYTWVHLALSILKHNIQRDSDGVRPHSTTGGIIHPAQQKTIIGNLLAGAQRRVFLLYYTMMWHPKLFFLTHKNMQKKTVTINKIFISIFCTRKTNGGVICKYVSLATVLKIPLYIIFGLCSSLNPLLHNPTISQTQRYCSPPTCHLPIPPKLSLSLPHIYASLRLVVFTVAFLQEWSCRVLAVVVIWLLIMFVQVCLALLALSSLTAASNPDCEELRKPLEDRNRVRCPQHSHSGMVKANYNLDYYCLVIQLKVVLKLFFGDVFMNLQHPGVWKPQTSTSFVLKKKIKLLKKKKRMVCKNGSNKKSNVFGVVVNLTSQMFDFPESTWTRKKTRTGKKKSGDKMFDVAF